MKKHILSDNELLELSEGTPLTEGGTLDELLKAAEQVAEAVRKTGVSPYSLDRQARILVYMRGFYFLGVLRGGEAYRDRLLLEDDIDADEPLQVPFELSEGCAEVFAADIQGQPSKTLKAIYKAVGLDQQPKQIKRLDLTATESSCYNARQ